MAGFELIGDTTERLVRLAATLNTIFFEGYVGQLIDSRMTQPGPVERYFRRCEQIAGHFHGGLAKMTAIFAGAPEHAVVELGCVGFWQGMALQIRNDLVDFLPSSVIKACGAQALEREPFEDFRNGKWTLPLLAAYQASHPDERARIESWLQERRFDDDIAAGLIKILLRAGGYQTALREITRHKAKAQDHLRSFASSPARELMAAMLDMVENARTYVDRLANRYG